MSRTPPRPSQQLIFAAAASVLAMAAFALSAPQQGATSHGGAALFPATAGIELPHAPALPSFLPR